MNPILPIYSKLSTQNSVNSASRLQRHHAKTSLNCDVLHIDGYKRDSFPLITYKTMTYRAMTTKHVELSAIHDRMSMVVHKSDTLKHILICTVFNTLSVNHLIPYWVWKGRVIGCRIERPYVRERSDDLDSGIGIDDEIADDWRYAAITCDSIFSETCSRTIGDFPGYHALIAFRPKSLECKVLTNMTFPVSARAGGLFVHQHAIKLSETFTTTTDDMPESALNAEWPMTIHLIIEWISNDDPAQYI